ncbi:hypothetical protein [Afipia clevelandensis]|uniref:Wadjet protein JetD C-terminal domain-containing protein n=1 Tax=Afipia clevelandensis ATCC 49720 TaxID=883079 RepID=K8P074_9BRAD|nr:hypothetical protein [Afipia clevelandensis]EKS31828.1 hypothetical protein HMPREF9696_04049 [Afipia clevelandensis ATCC 49720]
MGATVYVGGYPSLATQQALRVLADAVPAGTPIFHWSDIDPDGTWIFEPSNWRSGAASDLTS